jgi:outer membrane protein assembly factor BamB
MWNSKKYFKSCSLGLLGVLLAGCGIVDDFVFGKDNTIKPAKLPELGNHHNIVVDWKIPVGSFPKSAITPDLQPWLDGHTVYAASSDGSLIAVEKNNGHLLWKKKLPTGLLAGPVVQQSKLLINSDKSSVYLMDANNGHRINTFKLSSDSLAKPLINQNNMYVKTINSYLYKFDLNQGKKKWTYQEGAPDIILKASSSPVAYNNLIISGFSDGALFAFDEKSGHVVWQRHLAFPKGASDVERLVDIDTNPILEGDHMYVASYQGVVGSYLIDSEETFWQREASTFHDLAIMGSYLAMVDSRDVVWLLDKSNGNVIWKQAALKGRKLKAPFFWQGQLWVADHDAVLHGLSLESGKFISQFKLGGRMISTPIVDGKFCYLLNGDGKLYRLSMRS